MAGTAANSECRNVGWAYVFDERQANVKRDYSDLAAQLLLEHLLPGLLLCTLWLSSRW